MPETKDNEEWQQGFICDKEGNAIGFIKIHNTDENWGNFHFKGIVLCDIQVNPAYKGQNITLAILRKMKEHYNVNTIYSGETYSVTGYDMLMRLRGHSKSTGETLLTPQPHLVNKEHKITPSREEAYTFVKSWEEKQPKYRL